MSTNPYVLKEMRFSDVPIGTCFVTCSKKFFYKGKGDIPATLVKISATKVSKSTLGTDPFNFDKVLNTIVVAFDPFAFSDFILNSKRQEMSIKTLKQDKKNKTVRVSRPKVTRW